MLIYNYDSRGVYVGASEADPSPLEPGKFLIPARATVIAPPQVEPGQVPRWNGVEWTVAVSRAPAEGDAETRLRNFLNQNPDVASLIGSGNPAA